MSSKSADRRREDILSGEAAVFFFFVLEITEKERG